MEIANGRFLAVALSMTAQDFAARFSLEDWQQLCTDAGFNELVNRGEFAAAEVVAAKKLAVHSAPPAD